MVKQQYSWNIQSKPSFRLVGKNRRISCRNGCRNIRLGMMTVRNWNGTAREMHTVRII